MGNIAGEETGVCCLAAAYLPKGLAAPQYDPAMSLGAEENQRVLSPDSKTTAIQQVHHSEETFP